MAVYTDWIFPAFPMIETKQNSKNFAGIENSDNTWSFLLL